MEKSSFLRRNNTFWSFSDFFGFLRFFSWKHRDFLFLKKLFLDKNDAGFTLVELITAIGVLAILISTAIAVINPLEQYKKAQDSKRKTDLAQIQRALEVYYQDYHRYPMVSATGNRISTDGTDTGAVNWGNDWRPYMDLLPIDPVSAKSYAYWADPTGQSYALYAALDRGAKDPQACNGGAACTNASANSVFCGANVICTYGVTSPNISP